MAARFATITEEEIRQMNEEATPANIKSTCLVNTKDVTDWIPKNMLNVMKLLSVL